MGRSRAYTGAIVLALGAACTASAGGAPAPTLHITLEEAVRLAIRNNRGVRDAIERRVVERLALDVEEDRYRPQARIGAKVRDDKEEAPHADLSIGPVFRIPSGGDAALSWNEPLDTSGTRKGGWSLTFAQPLLKGFGRAIDSAPIRLARIAEQVRRLSLDETLASTIDSVIDAYRSLIRARRTETIAREALVRARRQLVLNKELIDTGRMAAREIIPTEAEVANRELAIAEREHAVANAEADLVAVLDIDPATRVRTPARIDLDRTHPDTREPTLAQALARRTDYRRSLLDIERAKLRLTLAEDERRWALTLETRISQERGGETDHAVSAALSILLGNRRPELGEVQARSDLRIAQRANVELRESIRIEIERAHQSVEVATRRRTLAERARALAEEKVALEQEKLARGLTSTVQLTRVEDDFVRAQTAALDAMLAHVDALVALDRTMGTTLDTWGVDAERLAQAPQAAEPLIAPGPEDDTRRSERPTWAATARERDARHSRDTRPTRAAASARAIRALMLRVHEPTRAADSEARADGERANRQEAGSGTTGPLVLELSSF